MSQEKPSRLELGSASVFTTAVGLNTAFYYAPTMSAMSSHGLAFLMASAAAGFGAWGIKQTIFPKKPLQNTENFDR